MGFVRAGLTIGQTEQMPGASRLNIKNSFTGFHVFRLLTRVKIVQLFNDCI